MNLKSGNALNWAAVISLIIGSMIISPSGSCLLYLVAAVFSAITAIFGTKKTRIVAIVILVLSIVLLAATYPKFDIEMTKYRESAYKKSSEGAKQSITSEFINPKQ